MNKFITNIIWFWESVKRFFYWGWKLRYSYDWDYSRLYEILYLKMERMNKCFKEDKHHNLYNTRRGKRFRIALYCVKRLWDNKYCEEDWEKYFKENPNKKTIKEDGIYYSLSNIELVKKLGNKEDYLRNQDLEVFLKILKKDINCWWV